MGELFKYANPDFMAIGMVGNYYEAWESLKTIGMPEGATFPKDDETLKPKDKYFRKGKNKVEPSNATKHVTKSLAKEQQRTIGSSLKLKSKVKSIVVSK